MNLFEENKYLEEKMKRLLKPIIKEAVGEYFAESGISFDPSSRQSEALIGTLAAAKLLDVERHMIGKFVNEQGLPCVQEKPYKFKVRDIEIFNEQRKKTKGK